MVRKMAVLFPLFPIHPCGKAEAYPPASSFSFFDPRKTAGSPLARKILLDPAITSR